MTRTRQLPEPRQRGFLQAHGAQQLQRALVDRRERFARLQDAATALFIGLRQSTRAIDELITHMHDEIRIG